MTFDIQFTTDPLMVPQQTLPTTEIGACVEFQGIVRETEGTNSLTGLLYEAYLPMAERHLRRLFEELATEFPVEHVTFIHRLGWVPVGEASLFIRVLSAHRGEAFTFCGKAIDRMKTDIPIWKKLPITR